MNTNTTHTKSFHHATAGIAALAIALSAGAAVAANPDTQGTHSHSDRMNSEKSHDEGTWLTLAPSNTLIGSDVIGSDNNTIGTITNFVVDRGTGRIAYAIIGHGGILSLGQEVFAVKYNRLNYLPVDKNFEINMTKEQANRQIEFLPENWEDLNHSDWMTELKEFVSSEDPFRYGDTQLTDIDIETVKGTVTHVSRDEFEDTDEVVLTVKRTSGKTAQVTLGPSWYVMGHDNAPASNDRVELEAFEHDGRLITTKANIAGKDLKLRKTDGTVAWETPSNHAPRFMMLADLNGQDIEIGGTTGGEADDTIVETTSGRVAFFAFDPNENFFGIADQISMVPWSVIQIGSDGALWSDLDNKRFENAFPMPENLETLRTERSIKSVYSRFSLNTPNFDPDDRSMYKRNHKAKKDRDGLAWNESSKLTRAFADGEERRISGDFSKYDAVELFNGAITATTIVMKTDAGEQEVILGPDWYIDKQSFDVERRDELMIIGREATIDGKTYIAAWNLQSESTTWTLWNDTTPAWVD